MIAEYVTKEELQRYLVLKGEGLNEMYQELRKANDAFYIREFKVNSRRPFSWRHPFRSRKETVILYNVLEHLGGAEARVLCFPSPNGSFYGFRTMIDTTELKTWMYGFLDGVRITLHRLEEYHPKPKFSVGDLVKVVDVETKNKICEEHGWYAGHDIEDLCGRQFSVLDVRYSYAKKQHTYQFEHHPNSVWIREELLEPYREEEQS